MSIQIGGPGKKKGKKAPKVSSPKAAGILLVGLLTMLFFMGKLDGLPGWFWGLALIVIVLSLVV